MIKFIIAVCLFGASTLTTAAGLLGLSKIYKLFAGACHVGAFSSCDESLLSIFLKTAECAVFPPASMTPVFLCAIKSSGVPAGLVCLQTYE